MHNSELTAQSLLTRGENLYSPAAVAQLSRIPGHRGGSHLNGSTLFRHITRGVRAANGELVRLEAVRVGSRWLTSLEAVSRFAEKLTAAALAAATPSDGETPETPWARTRRQQTASERLDAILTPKN